MWWKYSDRGERRTEAKRRSMASRCGGNAIPDRGERRRLKEKEGATNKDEREGTQGGDAGQKGRAGQRSRKPERVKAQEGGGRA